MIQTKDSEFVVIGCLCVLIMVVPPVSGAPRLIFAPKLALTRAQPMIAGCILHG